MPLGDVWGNSWGSSWNGHWKTAVVPPPPSDFFDTHDGIDGHKEAQRAGKKRRDDLRSAVETAFKHVLAEPETAPVVPVERVATARELRSLASFIQPQLADVDGLNASLKKVQAHLQSLQAQLVQDRKRRAVMAKREDEAMMLLMLMFS